MKRSEMTEAMIGNKYEFLEIGNFDFEIGTISHS